MAESSSPPANPGTAGSPGFLARHHFLLRRLHSLSGIIPVGVFVIFHLFTNAQLAVGNFQHEVAFIHNLPALLIMEISLWLAIGFHAGLGLVYTFVGNKPNVSHYRYGDNWRYFFQRVTGIIALIFIFLHVATLRWQWDLAGWHSPFALNDEGSGTELAQATVAMALENPWVVLLYIIGSLSVIYHWSNGLWTAAITWGLTLSVAAQRRWGYVCAAMGLVLTLFLGAAIYGAVTTEVTEEERQIMQQMLDDEEAQMQQDAGE